MSGIRPPLRPEPAARGMASFDPADVAELMSTAWGGMIGLAAGLDLDAPSRLPGWSVRDVLVHLGTWPEHPRFERLLDDAEHARLPERDDLDARNALVVAAHADADHAEIEAALARVRDRALDFLRSEHAELLGRQPAESPIGLLPVTCVIAASTYELAVHALDVADPADVPDPLLDAGIGALVDSTGALAARSGLRATFAVITPLGGWASASDQENWTTTRLGTTLPYGEFSWPSVHGAAADVLDASAGRRPALQLILSRRLRLHDLGGLMTLLPALESVPGLPGGPALHAATRALGQTGRLMGRLSSTLSGLRRG